MLALRNGLVLTVVAPAGGSPAVALAQADVLVSAVSGKVVAVGDVGETRDALEVDVKGRVVMPGLLDAHVHVTASSADLRRAASTPPSLMNLRAVPILKGMLWRGFTTVRDCGGADVGLATAIAEGAVEGPRLLYCGKAISPSGGHGDFRSAGEARLCQCCDASIGRVADGVDAVREAVRDEVRKGASHIKVMASGGVASPTDRITNLQYSVAELEAIVDEAMMAGLGVAAHAYTADAIARAVRAGVRSIEHGNLADDATLALMKDASAFLVPTIITYERLLADGEDAGMPADLVAKVGDLVERGVDTLARADALGVGIAYGSDLLGDMHPHQAEGIALHLRAQSPAAVLAALTIGPARLFDLEGEVGVLKPGAAADLLVVDGDVATDPSVLIDAANLCVIVKAGKVVKNTL